MSVLVRLGSYLIENYVKEVAASFLLGLSYLFRGKRQSIIEENELDSNNKISRKENLKKQKEILEENLKMYHNINTFQEFNKMLQDPNENFNPREIYRVITAKGFLPTTETFNFLLISSFLKKKFEEAFILKNEIMDITGKIIPNSTSLNIIIKGYGLYYKYLRKYEQNITYYELCSRYDLQIQNVLQIFHERKIKQEITALNYILETFYEQRRLEDMWIFYEKFIEKDKEYSDNLNYKEENIKKEDLIHFENLSEINSKEKFDKIKIDKIPADEYTYFLLLNSVKNLFDSDIKLNKKLNSEKKENIFKIYSKRILYIREFLLFNDQSLRKNKPI